MSIGDTVKRAIPRPDCPHSTGQIVAIVRDGAGGRWITVRWSATCTMRHRPDQLRATGYRLAA